MKNIIFVVLGVRWNGAFSRYMYDDREKAERFFNMMKNAFPDREWTITEEEDRE